MNDIEIKMTKKNPEAWEKIKETEMQTTINRVMYEIEKGPIKRGCVDSSEGQFYVYPDEFDEDISRFLKAGGIELIAQRLRMHPLVLTATVQGKDMFPQGNSTHLDVQLIDETEGNPLRSSFKLSQAKYDYKECRHGISTDFAYPTVAAEIFKTLLICKKYVECDKDSYRSIGYYDDIFYKFGLDIRHNSMHELLWEQWLSTLEEFELIDCQIRCQFPFQIFFCNHELAYLRDIFENDRHELPEERE